MRKRILCAMFALLLIVTLLPSVVGADETSVIDLAFTQRETAVGARYVTVGVDMNGNPGFVSATIPVKWDNSVLHLKSVSLSDDIVASESWAGMSMDEYTSNGTYYLSWNNDTREAGDFTTATGCLAELEFEIVDPSVDTSTQLQFDMTNRIANIMNFNMVDLNKTNTVTANPATITVTAQTSGGDTPDPDPVDGGQFVFSEVKGKPGEKVDVTITLKNNPGISSAKLQVAFDNDALTLDSVDFNSAVLGGMVNTSKTLTSPVTLNWFNGLTDIAGDVLYATLHFTISDQITAESNFEITATFNPNDVCDVNEENVDFSVSAGKVNVIIYIPGDINGDEEIDNKDLIRLFQHLSGWEVEYDMNAADVNGDGEVNNKDLIRLFQYLSGWEVEIF